MPTPERSSPTPSRRGPHRSPRLVFVVDDDRRSARLLARMMRDDGYQVEVAYDGAAAVGRLSRDPVPGVLVTDLRMPHVDGLAVARYAVSRDPDLRVIFVTSYPELVGGRQLGAEPPLVHGKPVDYGALRHQLDEALER